MKKTIGLFIAIAVFIVQAMLVPGTGLSWDEPASFFVGRANLKFWQTGNRQYVLDLLNKPLFADSPIQYIYGEDIYPPFPFLISSAFSYIFAEKWHVMHVVDAHHLGEVAIASVGVWALYGLMIEAGLSLPAAVVGTLAYAVYPSVWGPMRNDAKDIPLVSMIIVSMYSFLVWLRLWQKKDHVRSLLWGIGFAVSFGLAGATKPTAAIMVPIIGCWFIMSVLRSTIFRKTVRPVLPFFIQIGFFGVIGSVIFFLAWPWLWDNPIGKLTQVFEFFRTVGYAMPTPFFGTMYSAGIDVPKIYPFGMLAIQTPIEISILFCLGLLYALYLFLVKANVRGWFFIVWFVLGISRFFIPGMIIYAGIRHFIDVIPAFFVLVGFGVEILTRILASVLCAPVKQAFDWWVNRRDIQQPLRDRLPISIISKLRMTVLGKTDTNIRALLGIACGGVILLHQGLISYQLYPFEMSYFNFIPGGLKGVAQKGLFDVGQAAGAKEAMEAIAHDAKGSSVSVYSCNLAHIARFYTASNVRITTEPYGATYTIIPNSPSWFGGPLTYSRANQINAYTVTRANAELFYVFKYKRPDQWGCGYETVTNYEYN